VQGVYEAVRDGQDPGEQQQYMWECMRQYKVGKHDPGKQQQYMWECMRQYVAGKAQMSSSLSVCLQQMQLNLLGSKQTVSRADIATEGLPPPVRCVSGSGSAARKVFA
jgi:hypothetical protein